MSHQKDLHATPKGFACHTNRIWAVAVATTAAMIATMTSSSVSLGSSSLPGTWRFQKKVGHLQSHRIKHHMPCLSPIHKTCMMMKSHLLHIEHKLNWIQVWWVWCHVYDRSPYILDQFVYSIRMMNWWVIKYHQPLIATQSSCSCQRLGKENVQSNTQTVLYQLCHE